MKYDLPLPFVKYRSIKPRAFLHRGDVVAFRTRDYRGYRTGLMVMADSSMFLVAVNFEGYVDDLYYYSEIPDDFELFEANADETRWGMRFFFESEYGANNSLDSILKFVETEFPKDNIVGDWRVDFCNNISASLPWLIDSADWEKTKKELWAMTRKELNNVGLQFNQSRTECYCFLIGVLMILENSDNEKDYKPLLDKLHKRWWLFAWMYAMVIGRLLRTRFINFTSVVNQLNQSYYKSYLHLFLPLIEENIDKICFYNPSEKRYKLENAIKKMQKVEAIEQKETDLDELYGILFPKHFKQAMASSRPAATIAELRQEVATKDKIIEELKTSMDNTSNSYYQALEQLKKALASVETDVISADDLLAAFLRLPADLALSYFGTMSTLFAMNLTWQKYAPQIQEKILAKQREQQEKQQELNEALIKAAEKPTAIYGDNNQFMAGAELVKMNIPKGTDPAEIAMWIAEKQQKKQLVENNERREGIY